MGRAQQSKCSKAFSAGAGWTPTTFPEFWDCLYWVRIVAALLLGAAFGVLKIEGFVGFALYATVSSFAVILYSRGFIKVDPDDFGGDMAILGEGFMPALAAFVLVWTFVYNAVHIDTEAL
eukprot:g4665.t1